MDKEKIKFSIVISYFLCYYLPYEDKCTSQTNKVAAMEEKNEFYVVRARALPEGLLKTAQAERLLALNKAMTVLEATQEAGIGRSTYYKYKDDIFHFNEHSQGRTITMMLQLSDVSGLLSNVLNYIAGYEANILTIHQSIPVGGVASVTVSMEVRKASGDISEMIKGIENLDGVQYVKIIARE